MDQEKILLIDDDSAILRICTLYLKAEKFDVVSLAEPELLLETARREKPDLAILDINKPVDRGIKIFRKFRLEEDFHSMPMLVLFGSEAARLSLYSDDAPAPDDHLAKPFDTLELVARIKALLRRKTILEKSNRMISSLISQVRNGENRSEKLSGLLQTGL